MVSPDFTATRTFLPSLVSKRTRVGLPVLGSATATLLTCSGASLRSRPPCGSCWFGFLWRVMIFTPATTTLPSFGRLCVTSPVLPLSLPDRMTTVSPFFILGLPLRSEEHTSELQVLMRTSYSVFCLQKKNN